MIGILYFDFNFLNKNSYNTFFTNTKITPKIIIIKFAMEIIKLINFIILLFYGKNVCYNAFDIYYIKID